MLKFAIISARVFIKVLCLDILDFNVLTEKERTELMNKLKTGEISQEELVKEVSYEGEL